MSSKKSKSKTKVQQAELRKMMKDLKNKKSDGVKGYGYNASVHMHKTESRKLANPEVMKTAVKDRMKLKALVSGQKVESNSLKRPVTNTNVEMGRSQNAKVAKMDKNSTKKAGKQGSKSAPGILLGDYGSDSEEENKEEEEKMETENEEKTEKQEETKQDSALPEGFFDDPEIDAKFRGVETPAHVMDREYEKFEKEIKQETGQSEQIVEEDQEVETHDRQIDEIDEQILCYSRVEKLNIVRDEMKQRERPRKMEVTEPEEDEEEIDEEGLDWREKDAFM